MDRDHPQAKGWSSPSQYTLTCMWLNWTVYLCFEVHAVVCEGFRARNEVVDTFLGTMVV